MTPYGLDDRIAENRAIWTDYWKAFTIERFGVTLTIIALFVIVVGYINQHDMLAWTHIFGDFYANVSSELLSIVITVAVLDRLNTRRQNAQELTRLKALMGSNQVAVTQIAIAELKAKDWLQDGSLQNVELIGANLSGAVLFESKLQGAVLTTANLSDAILFGVNLSNADLEFADLSGADLAGANLNRAYLGHSNLSGANLTGSGLSSVYLGHSNLSGATLKSANLSDANLESVNLKHANMYGVKCNKDTVLPDGTQWTPDTDWKTFDAVVIEDTSKWVDYLEEHGVARG